MSYLVSGNNPAAIKTAERNIFTATAGQTTFTISQGYQVGDIDVFLNGVRLVDSDDYFATNGSTIVLTSGATVGDSLVVVCYRPYQVADFYTKSEQDVRYVNATGDTMTGNLGVGVTPTAPITVGRVDSSNEGGQIDLCRSIDNISAWAIDVYGNTTTPSLRIIDNVSAAVRLQIDGSGRITIPAQPKFRVSETTGLTLTNDAPIIMTGTSASASIYNPGGYYNTSTGRFTAPVSGFYHFDAIVRHDGAVATGAYSRVRPYKNGSHMEWIIGDAIRGSYTASQSYDSVTISFNVELAANDYIDIRWGCANASSVALTNSSWSGYLIS